MRVWHFLLGNDWVHPYNGLSIYLVTAFPLHFVRACAATRGLPTAYDAGPPVRATRDVDVIVEVLTLMEYHDLEHQLERAGFSHDLRLGSCTWSRAHAAHRAGAQWLANLPCSRNTAICKAKSAESS
jgi:hypothetical protein